MKVKMYSVEDDNSETLEIECDFFDLEWPEKDDPEIAIAMGQLLTVGHYYTGGGAAPVFVIRKV